MGRRLREEAHGAIHHVVPQGNGRHAIVLDDHDRRSYLERFFGVAYQLGWIVHASCLLDTHHHGIVETPRPDLGRGMRLVIGGHAHWFNARHGRSGAVFGDRYWSVRVGAEGHLLRACLYALLNPVAAGLVQHPRDWPWCSYGAVVADGCSHRLAAFLGHTPYEGRERFLAMVDSAVEIIHAQRLAERRDVLRAAGDVVEAGARRGNRSRA
jgi:REP element-mobilizing transposase RayT